MKLQYRNETVDLDDEDLADETVSNLAARCADHINADVERVSLLFLPKPGLMKYPFPDRKLSEFLTPTTRIKLVGSPKAEVKKMDEHGRNVPSTRRWQLPKPRKSQHWQEARDAIMYTFQAIEPLPYLPNPEKSKRFLERLANDPGIKFAMRKHKFSVSLLTEMDPAQHTTHESRTLGLNRNRGEVIELRLRTDAYDGYRDYKVIRKTLCHELSHNVWGEHDRNFWDLTKQIEKEVEQNDTRHGGHRLSNEEFYNPEDAYDETEHADSGGWTQGDFVLGRSKDGPSVAGLSRREILAQAAMIRKEKQMAQTDNVLAKDKDAREEHEQQEPPT
ncbi:hypothetical protein H2204_004099 [Knufia peltigerae]|uniref:WLM domain-containing protein n=1 Tax=Knufia peltigerae TaxID=1002370 RepID=A0AA38Y7V2_9EURO|nr:hypothetical protein H2204_004099 [Knufia peltigerae]